MSIFWHWNLDSEIVLKAKVGLRNNTKFKLKKYSCVNILKSIESIHEMKALSMKISSAEFKQKINELFANFPLWRGEKISSQRAEVEHIDGVRLGVSLSISTSRPINRGCAPASFLIIYWHPHVKLAQTNFGHARARARALNTRAAWIRTPLSDYIKKSPFNYKFGSARTAEWFYFKWRERTAPRLRGRAGGWWSNRRCRRDTLFKLPPQAKFRPRKAALIVCDVNALFNPAFIICVANTRRHFWL